MAEPNVLVALEKVTINRRNEPVLRDLSLQIRAGDCWAVVGKIGSGKTTFLQVLAGQLPAPVGTLTRHAAVSFVSFKEESHRFSYGDYFYQQRYQATMSDTAPIVRQYLQLTESPDDIRLIEQLGLAPLLDLSFIKLSNGQTRKARIAKALLSQSPLILLDNPFVGLDRATRVDLTTWLSSLVGQGSTLVLVTGLEAIPSFVTHVLNLDAGSWAGTNDSYPAKAPTGQQNNSPLPVVQTPIKPLDFTDVFRLHNVTVRYGERLILTNLTWTVQAGEKWALLGPNGVGKSVLLSLLYGDHPQAYANDVSVFGHRRGKSNESIWEVKRRIGFVSPELHLYFPLHLTARQVVLTGLTDTLTVPKSVSSATENDLTELAQYFGMFNRLNCPFGTLSTGEQRLTLLIRALIKNPPVLLLDEPFQALDNSSINLARQLLDALPDKSLLFVTHDQRELPSSVDRTFELGFVNPG
ncbi:MAG: transporter [Spirosoma sp.]|nr:transporter [Spirosoma sp.]